MKFLVLTVTKNGGNKRNQITIRMGMHNGQID